MGRYIVITKLVIFGAFLLSLDSLFLIGSFYWKVRSLSGACYIVITRFVISCRFIISGGSLHRTVRGSLSGDTFLYRFVASFVTLGGSLYRSCIFLAC